MLSAFSPFHLVQNPSPWVGTPTFRVGLPTSILETPSQTWPKVCLLGNSRCYQVANVNHPGS